MSEIQDQHESPTTNNDSIPLFFDDPKIIEDMYAIKLMSPSFQEDFSDFLQVGPQKILSSMPITRIQQLDGYGFFLMEEHASRNGLTAQVVKDCVSVRSKDIKKNGLFMYDTTALQSYLHEQKNTLNKYDIPSEAREFVKRIGHHIAWYDEMPEIAEIIATCYNTPVEQRIKPTDR